MSLSGLNRISVRPRGGVAKVELIPTTAVASVDFATHNYAALASIAQAVGASAWAFREDCAWYSEESVGDEKLSSLVRHTLVMEFPATHDSCRAVNGLADTSAVEGVAAVITMASGEVIIAGYSSRFGVEYPLRVVKREITSGRTPADFPTVTITLESVDADPAFALI